MTQRRSGNRAHEPAHPDCCRQVPDIRRTAADHVEGRDDDQHVQAPADERLETISPTRLAAPGTRAISRKPCIKRVTAALSPTTRSPSTCSWPSSNAASTRVAAPVAKIALTPAVATTPPRRSGRPPFRRSRAPTSCCLLQRAPAACSRATAATPGAPAGRASTRCRRRPQRHDCVTLIRKRADGRDRERRRTDEGNTSRNRSRRNRSASDAAKGASTAAGSMRATPAMPTAEVPPTRYANTPSATKCAHSAATSPPDAARPAAAARSAPRRRDSQLPRRPHRASQPFARRKGNGTCPGARGSSGDLVGGPAPGGAPGGGLFWARPRGAGAGAPGRTRALRTGVI